MEENCCEECGANLPDECDGCGNIRCPECGEINECLGCDYCWD